MRLPTVPNVETTDLRRFLIAVRENLKKLNELYFTEIVGLAYRRRNRRIVFPA